METARPSVSTEEGALAADVGDGLRVLAAGGGGRVDDAADAERAVNERGDGAGADVGRDAGADAVGGLNVVLAGRQRGAFAGFHAIAEEDLGGGVGLIQRGEDGG